MYDLIAITFVSVAAAIIGWVQLLFARRDKRIEKTEKEAAYAKLAAFERRAQATLFQPTVVLQNTLMVENGQEFHHTYASILNRFHLQVPADLAAGQSVYLPIFNLGAGFIDIHVTVPDDGAAFRFIRYVNGSPDICGVLWYSYDPTKRETMQQVFFNYTAPNGVVRRDQYEHRYGFRHLHRIDPPMITEII